MADNLPVRAKPGLVGPRSGSAVGPVLPTNFAHDPARLDFSGSVVDREVAWERFGTTIHEKVAAKLGTLVEWWVEERDDGHSATILGTRALITISPTVNAKGGRAHQLRSILLDEESFRHKVIAERSTGRPAAEPVRARPGLATPAPARNPLADRLDPAFAGFLGNLPIKAQELLQEPFRGAAASAAQQTIWNGWFSVREGAHGGLGQAKFTVWCYLASARFVTFAHGHGHGPSDMSGPIYWNLTCTRASVRTPGTDVVRG